LGEAIREFGWRELLDCAQGDDTDTREAAWAEIRRRLATLTVIVRRGIRSLTAEDADDIVQNIVMRLDDSRFRAAVREATSTYAYLVRVVRNTAFDLLRQRSSFVTLEEARGMGTTPEAGIIVGGLVAALPTRDRELLHKRYWEKMSIRELALESGLPYSTVAKRLFRIVESLRNRVREPPSGWTN
jgi:RNA polymerase sigma factor (sigma-70 family)